MSARFRYHHWATVPPTPQRPSGIECRQCGRVPDGSPGWPNGFMGPGTMLRRVVRNPDRAAYAEWTHDELCPMAGVSMGRAWIWS